MWKKLPPTVRTALVGAVSLTAVCALMLLCTFFFGNARAPLTTVSGREALKNAKNGETILLSSPTDAADRFAANYFPTLNGAIGDGSSDDTAALQKTLEQAAETGGSVYLPKGVYVICEPLTVPSGVTLIGDFTSPNAKENYKTVLFVEDNEKTRSASVLTLEDGASLRGITVYYESQSPESPVTYPVSVTCRGSASIDRLTLVNCHQGIFVSGKGDVSIRSVWMSPLDYGVLISDQTGSVLLEDLSVSPTHWLNVAPQFFAEEGYYETVIEYLHAHLHGVILERVQDVTLNRVTVEQGEVGLLYNVPSECEGVLLASELTLSSLSKPLSVLSLPKYGATVSDSVLRPLGDEGADTVVLASGVKTPLIFSSCSFGGTPKTVIRGNNPSLVSFYHCDFGTWWRTCFEMEASTFLAVKPTFRTDLPRAELGQNGFGLLYDSEQIATSSELFFSVPSDQAEATASVRVPSLRDKGTTVPTEETVYDARKYGVLPTADDCSDAMDALLKKAALTGGIVFLPEGEYHFTRPFTVPSGVRLLGVGESGRYATTLSFTVRKYEKALLTLTDAASLQDLAVRVLSLPENAETFAVLVTGTGGRIVRVSVTAARAILLERTEQTVLQHITAQISAMGVYAEGSNDLVLRDLVLISPSGRSGVGVCLTDSQASLSGLRTDGLAVGIRTQGTAKATATLVAVRNGLCGIENSAELTVTVLGALNVFSGLSVSDGTLTVQGAVFGNASESGTLSLQGGSVLLQAATLGTTGSATLTASGGSARVTGCIWVGLPACHARATGGSIVLNANLIPTVEDKEFGGIETKYLTVSQEGGTVTDRANVMAFVYVEGEDGGSESGSEA